MIVNLPGSPKGAVESLNAMAELVPHAVDLLAGRTDTEELGLRRSVDLSEEKISEHEKEQSADSEEAEASGDQAE